MHYFERKLCVKLLTLDCVSDSCGFYSITNGLFFYSHINGQSVDSVPFDPPTSIPAFTVYDFIAPTEQARSNAYNLCAYSKTIEKFYLLRDRLVSAMSEKHAEELIKSWVGL